MAALRIFARTSLPSIRATGLTGDSWKCYFPSVAQIDKRWESVTVGSGKKEQVVELPEFEVTKDPEDWKFVEWTMRERIIPKAPSTGTFPSGWHPPSPNAKNQPYYVERTRNHMIPVYLRIRDRGMRRLTKIRKVHGDIMLLEKELKAYVEKKAGKDIGSQINEPASLIIFRGDHVAHCLEFLEAKGF